MSLYSSGISFPIRTTVNVTNTNVWINPENKSKYACNIGVRKGATKLNTSPFTLANKPMIEFEIY